MSRGREAAAARANGGSNLPAPANESQQGGTMRQLLEQMKPELALALPKHMTPDRMARQALTVFRTTPGLAACTPESFLGALMTCAQVGLEPGPQGHVWLIPFKNRKKVGGQWVTVPEVTFMLGYQGMLELARRSGELMDVSAHTIYENELEQGRFEVEYGTAGHIMHKPIVFGERGKPIGYYARARLRSGSAPFVVLSREDVEHFRRRSATQKADTPSGPWQTDYEPMAWKTCVRRLSRWLPQSPELAAAVAHEDTVRHVTTGEVIEDVLTQQPPALEAGDGEADDMGADPSTGELPTGSGEAEPVDPDELGPDDGTAPDPWANAGEPGDPGDPWAGK
jgi:recombination protein RecT